MLYLYCLGEKFSAGMLEGAGGVGEAEPRVVDCSGLAAVVSEFGEARVSVTRENVLAHERVIGRVLAGETTPLPFRFGTIVDQRRLESYVASQLISLKALLERVRGAVEMSVKIIWNLEEIKEEASGAEAAALPETGASAGTRFLLAKRRELGGDDRLKARAAELQNWLERLLQGTVRDSFVQVNPAEKLFLMASHLVEREQLAAYRERLEDARKERPDLHFLTSGPWAPYSFSSLFS